MPPSELRRIYGRRIAVLLALVALLAGHACPAIASPEIVDRLDRQLTRLMAKRHIPGVSALVIRDGAVAWERHLGFADVDLQEPVAPDTMFMLASTSKTVTAVALMQLVEQGAIGLDDPIDGLLPYPVRNPAFPSAPITTRMLLTHTSSIVDGWYSFDSYVQGDSPIALQDFLQSYLTEGPPPWSPDNFRDDPPGEAYEYSNEGIALAGVLVERMSGQSFEAYCQDHIFAPLGMVDTGWRLAGLDGSRIAMPYRYEGGSAQYVPFGQYGYPDIPNGALRTTARQLAKFLLMFMNDGTSGLATILAPSTVAAMRTAQVPDLDRGQGLVWFAQRVGRRRMIGHDGGDDGVSTDMFYEPATGIGIIVLANDDGGGADPILKRIAKLADRL